MVPKGETGEIGVQWKNPDYTDPSAVKISLNTL